MKIDNSFNIALNGIQRGLASARGHAAEIASADTLRKGGPGALVEPLVGLKLDELQVKSSVEVLKAADRMIGSLLDEKA
ncbi:MAG TPA: hypothetical protein ENJ79_03195 [Gammaproteobacteria bacterium]|nr:hypothetical protein [Gammaproteobacteria bacterium]